MKIIRYILTSFIITTLLLSCDNKFEEINSNLDSPVVIPSSMIIGTVVRNVANELYSTFNGLEIGESWAQHISMVQYNDPERYKPRVTSMDNLWSVFYTGASNANQMYNLAVLEENSVNQGIALVLKAYCFSLLTDFYGDVPFSEALKGPSDANFTPVYDKQQDIYTGILALLDEAMPLLSSGIGTTDPSMDILYAGDNSKWAKFAASLKFRALMRISAKTDVKSELQALVSGGNLFASNDDEAKLVFLSTSPEANPIYETIVAGGRGEFKLAETFINYLTSNSDPRLPVYAQPAVATGTYVGKPSGHSESPLPGYGYDDVSSIGTLYLEATAPGYFMSYSELLFLMAEASQKGYISGGVTATQNYYEAGIQNSLTENGVGESFAQFKTVGGVAFNTNNALQQIGTQKWAALFCQGFEAWTEWRRTKFPALSPVPDRYFIDQIPNRLKYESNEVSINSINYKAAILQQGGADDLVTPIWWLKN
ncbi:MAG TPA: SusD/RagB family nutrient-binding outer membrane lipoprotein [Prolixibacteraceae bacterium]|nr:SusD/RagB family nutrient-binding outer membrane lipoprotein [Prolixibacteraceae bacterium]